MSFSWFNFNREATVSEFNVTTIKVNNTLISIDGEEWKDGIIFPNESGYSFWPVAGDGTSFYIQRQYDDEGNRIGKWETLENDADKEVFVPSFDYKAINVKESNALICLDFKVKSELASLVYLDAENSVVKPGNESNLADYAAGAMRVAMYSVDEESEQATLLFMWVPNTTYEVALREDGKIDVVTNSEETEDITFITDADGSSKVIKTNGQSSGYAPISGEGSPYLFWGDLNNMEALKEPIIELEGGVAQSLRIVIWFEATDRECETFFAGGNVVTELYFKAESKEGGEAN